MNAILSKPMICLGTRPEAIKLAPLILELKSRGISPIVVSSGQHDSLLTPFLNHFEINPDERLSILNPGQSLSELSSRALLQLEPVLKKHQPSLVFVQGDTTTTAMSALAAFYQKIPVAHVEAGLRTYHPYSPFPEEMNRQITTRIAQYHFCPTTLSQSNLESEGVTQNVWTTGNTGVDALRLTLEKMDSAGPSTGKKKILVTCHRRENHGAPLKRIFSAIRRIHDLHADCEVVFPAHPNPQVQAALSDLRGLDRVKILPPLDYIPFVQEMKDAFVILTDSGGVQEEAPYLGLPIFVMRETTERPEGITAGCAELVGSDEDAIVAKVGKCFTDDAYRMSFKRGVNPYGDGYAAKKIVEALGI